MSQQQIQATDEVALTLLKGTTLHAGTERESTTDQQKLFNGVLTHVCSSSCYRPDVCKWSSQV